MSTRYDAWMQRMLPAAAGKASFGRVACIALDTNAPRGS
jgi:hypothetical protein